MICVPAALAALQVYNTLSAGPSTQLVVTMRVPVRLLWLLCALSPALGQVPLPKSGTVTGIQGKQPNSKPANAGRTPVDACKKAGLSKCGKVCVDTSKSPKNCGACGVTCPKPTAAASYSCKQGICQARCLTGYTLCGNSCAAIDKDVSNCGACGNACKPPANAVATCTAGRCGYTCLSGYTDCNGACVDLQRNSQNCNACGQVGECLCCCFSLRLQGLASASFYCHAGVPNPRRRSGFVLCRRVQPEL